MKTLNDIKHDMSQLYDDLRSGTVEREAADSLANVAGKFLKAEQLQLGREIFEAELGKRISKQPKRLAAAK